VSKPGNDLKKNLIGIIRLEDKESDSKKEREITFNS
jgi:hypothetical protein